MEMRVRSQRARQSRFFSKAMRISNEIPSSMRNDGASPWEKKRGILPDGPETARMSRRAD